MDELIVSHLPDGLPAVARQAPMVVATTAAVQTEPLLEELEVPIPMIAATLADAITFILLRHLNFHFPPHLLVVIDQVILIGALKGREEVIHPVVTLRDEAGLKVFLTDLVDGDEAGFRIGVEPEVGPITVFTIDLLQQVVVQRVAGVEQVGEVTVALIAEVIQRTVLHGTSPFLVVGEQKFRLYDSIKT